MRHPFHRSCVPVGFVTEMTGVGLRTTYAEFTRPKIDVAAEAVDSPPSALGKPAYVPDDMTTTKYSDGPLSPNDEQGTALSLREFFESYPKPYR